MKNQKFRKHFIGAIIFSSLRYEILSELCAQGLTKFLKKFERFPVIVSR